MSVLLAAAYFVAAIGLHALLCHVPPAASAVVKYLAAGGLVGLLLVGHLLALFGWSTPTLAGALSFALASELYIFLFTLIHSSVSAVWLRRLRRGPMERTAAARLYDPAWMVDSRLDKLVANDLLVPDGSSYRLTARAERMIATFGRLRAFFGHERRASEPAEHA